MSDEPTFASRWSDRKKAVEQEAETEAASEAIAEVEELVEDVPEKTEAELLEELGLKDPDQMEAGDDFSAFMSKTIPAQLRNRALRKLWLSNPALANLDELLEYGEDYSIDPTAAVEKIASAYKVGRGYLDKWAEEDAAKEKAALEAAENAESFEALELESDEVVADCEEVEEKEIEVAPVEETEEVELEIAQPVEVSMISRRKRMQFTFE